MEQEKIIKPTIIEQKQHPDIWEEMRYLKRIAELFNSRLDDLPKIKNELAAINDRLIMIESCLINKGFLEEEI